MTRSGLGLKSVIAASAGIIAIYMASLVTEASPQWIFELWLLPMVALVWMRIKKSERSLHDLQNLRRIFYQDREDIRRNGKE
jgi:hypothetical protein